MFLADRRAWLKKMRPKCSRSGKTSACSGQKRPAGVDEVDARQLVLLGDLLGAQVLLHGEREVRAALDGGVVRDDDAAAALDHPDPGHDPGRRRLAVVDLPGGERVQLEECRARVDEQVDALPRGELAARAMALGRPLTAAGGDERGALAQLREQPSMWAARAANASEARSTLLVNTVIEPATRHRDHDCGDRKDERKSLHARAPRGWAQRGYASAQTATPSETWLREERSERRAGLRRTGPAAAR